jgi:hypothetical protein
MIKPGYGIGSRFTMRESALENYGEKYRGRVFTVKGVYTHYCSPDQTHNDPTGHPGFDPSGGSPLYETDDLNFALYAWEMRPA